LGPVPFLGNHMTTETSYTATHVAHILLLNTLLKAGKGTAVRVFMRLHGATYPTAADLLVITAPLGLNPATVRREHYEATYSVRAA
jgi:hypothetical protein